MTCEIVFDTETTGFDPKEGHKVVEIGAIKVYDKMRTDRPEDTLHIYINPERDIPEDAIKVHGITNERVENEPTFAEYVEQIIEFFGDHPVVAHNAQFDMRFMNAELEQAGYPAMTNKVVDTLQIARKKFPGSRVTLDALCNRFDVDLSARTFHGALLDSQLLADVYLELSGGRQHGLVLGDETANADDAGASVEFSPSLFVGDVQPSRAKKPTNDEVEAHQAFIEKNKISMWIQPEEA